VGQIVIYTWRLGYTVRWEAEANFAICISSFWRFYGVVQDRNRTERSGTALSMHTPLAVIVCKCKHQVGAQKPPTNAVRVCSTTTVVHRLTAVTLIQKRKCTQVGCFGWFRRGDMIDGLISVVRLDWEMQWNPENMSTVEKHLFNNKRLRQRT